MVACILHLISPVYLVEWLGFNTKTLQNLANIIAIELSLFFSFFIYRIWVWPGGSWKFRDVVFRQIPLYHLSAGAAILSRIFLIFPILNWLGINYLINTLIGVLVSASINYIISDRLVFKAKPNSVQLNEKASTDIYRPEGLESSVSTNSPSFQDTSNDVNLFSLVIPAHNEEGSIVHTVQSIVRLLDQEKINYEILVVNDNSRDQTEVLLQKMSLENDRVSYINNYFPNGFGFAIRCGLENFSGDAVAIVMADSSDSPTNIVDYYNNLQEGYDCVFGSRFIKGGKFIDYPIHKLYVNRLANLFIQVLFGLKLNDTTNAFKAYRKEVINGVSPLLSHHFNLTVEIPLKAIVRGYSYKIIPITWENRKAGISKLKIKEMGSRYLFIVLSIWLEKHLSCHHFKWI